MLLSFSLLCEALAVGLLAFMCYQDWQARSISWPAFPVLGALLLLSQLPGQSMAMVGEQVMMNWGLLTVLVLVLRGYVRWRFRHTGLRLRDCLGSGDILFWAMAAVYFSPGGFWLYFLGSCLGALLISLLVVSLTQRQRGNTFFQVPLAGLQAACLLVVVVAHWLYPQWEAAVADHLRSAWPV
jgi:predicted ferric reductase